MNEQRIGDVRDPFPHVVQHVASTRFERLPASTIERCKTFLVDTFGVGAAGAHGTKLDTLEGTFRRWGRGEEASVWGSGEQVPATSAAFINGYRIHSLEFDCLHERAVLHPMATILAAVMAFAERCSKEGRAVSGKALINAIVVGVDVATFLGFAARGPVRFFRPSTAGGFGASAAIANIAGFDADTVANALGIQYSQTSGTMQAHVEGSPCLGLQVGFAARAAVTSCDLASAGFSGPHDILTGRHGYFRLFENDKFEIEGEIDRLGRDYQIEELSHKPFPSGRLTHGSVDALMQFRERLGFRSEDVELFECFVPSLVARQVGRPDIPSPEPNYAKLCIAFVAATYLRRGRVDVFGFSGRDDLEDPETHDFARRVQVIEDDNPDPNAMAPQRFRLTLKDGSIHELELTQVFGHPTVPLRPEDNVTKFLSSCESGGVPASKAHELLSRLNQLEDIEDVSVLIPFLCRASDGS